MTEDACTNMLYADAETVRVPTPPAFDDAHATWIGCTYGKPVMSETTAKYAQGDVDVVNVYSAISSGSAQNWSETAVNVRESTNSLMYEVTRSRSMPSTLEGTLRRLD